MGFVIGIDGGTESLRAMVFDLQGMPLGSASVGYETVFSAPAYAEQDPEAWWQAMGMAVKGALADANLSSDQILALALDTTCCSVVALGQDKRPLRPAMIWMDVRSSAEAEEVAATGDPALRVNGAGSGQVSAEWMIPKALWLKRNEPETFGDVRYICEYQDYLNYRHDRPPCTGSLNNMSVRWHYQIDHGGLPLSLLEALEAFRRIGRTLAE